MRGYNYGTLGFDAARIHEVGSNQAMLEMLRQKRCDLIIGYLEIWESFEAKGVLDLEGIDYVEIPESEPLVFHVWVSRNYPDAQELMRAINEGLAELEASGRKREIFDQYAIR